MAKGHRSGQYSHLDYDLWTPITPEIVELLEQSKRERGLSWNLIARNLGIRERVIRRYRTSLIEPEKKKPWRRRRAIPMKHLDKILSFCGANHRLEDFPWYTPAELVELGIWIPANTDPAHRSHKRWKNDPRSMPGEFSRDRSADG